MKNDPSGSRLLWLISSVGLSCFLVISFFNVATDQPSSTIGPLQSKASVAGEDDPEARWHYEFMRIRDPRTKQVPPKIREKELAFAGTLPARGSVMYLGKGIGMVQAAHWNQRGPFNVGGRTRALAIDVTNENVILAGGVSGGMWKSTDGGGSWVRTTNLSQSIQSVSCLAQDTRVGKRNIWYHGTGEFQGNSADGGAAYYRGDGIYRSSDGGGKLGDTSFYLDQQTSDLR